MSKSIRVNLERREVPPIDKIGGIFPRGYVSIVASKAGVGKTWFMLRIAMALSKGEDVFRVVYKPVPRKVCIFVGETGIDLLVRRLNVMRYGFDSNLIIAYDGLSAQMENEAFDASSAEGRNRMVSFLLKDLPDIVFIDTLASFMSGDESDTVCMKSVISFFQRLAQRFNIAVVLNHHLRKNVVGGSVQKKTQDELIGSSLLSRMSGSIFLMVANEEKNVIDVHNVKSWDEKFPVIRMTIIPNSGFVDIDLKIDSNRRIVMLFEEFIRREREFTIATVNELLCIGNDNTRYFLDKYVDSGKLEKEVSLKEGGGYVTTYRLKN